MRNAFPRLNPAVLIDNDPIEGMEAPFDKRTEIALKRLNRINKHARSISMPARVCEHIEAIFRRLGRIQLVGPASLLIQL